MRNIKAVLEYDGSGFFGFQRQPHHPTVQESFEKALSKLLNRKTKIQAASGRTDTGVHAEHQVVNFKTEKSLSLSQIQKGLNTFLPPSIAVKEVKEVPPDFHARFSAQSKIYEYRIWNSPARSPLIASQSLHVPYPLNINRMRQGARLLRGTHDFRSFVSLSNPSGKTNGRSEPERAVRNTVRTISKFEIKRKGNLMTLQVQADGFLYRMVRNLVGTLIELGGGRLTLHELRNVLSGKDRRLAGQAAPACGLTLVNVTY